MESKFLSQAAKFLQEQRNNKRWTAVFLCLAAVVALGTTAALKMYGQAMTHKVKVLDCAYEVHEHTEDCYDEEENLTCVYADYVVHVHNDDCYDPNNGNLVCQIPEREPHEHTDECWEEQEVLVCGLEEGEEESGEEGEEPSGSSEPAAAPAAVKAAAVTAKEAHEHDDSCYTKERGELICTEGTGPAHEHDDSCYTETLTCGQEEHTHGSGCYEKTLTCDNEEEDHEHGDGCYSEELACDLEEHEHGGDCYSKELTCTVSTEEGGHEHTDDCYEWTETLTCTEGTEAASEEPEAAPEIKSEASEEPKEEENKGHVHSEKCYEKRKVLTCGELELHTHGDECYTEDCFDEEGNLIEGSVPSCGLLQLEEHVHGSECLKTVELTADEIAALAAGAALHIHDESCYDEEGNLICGHDATHIHKPECYDEEGRLICGYEGGGHKHDESCYDEEGNLICKLKEAAHIHTKECYDEEGNLICNKEIHEHGKDCYDIEGNLICGYEDGIDHQHDADCYDEEGTLTCGFDGMKDHQHDARCYDEEGTLTCGYKGVKDHEHDAKCYNPEDELICGYEGVKNHEHAEGCYDEEGNLICGYEAKEAYENVKVCEKEGYIVTVKYHDDANIPEEAELIAEEITPDTDSEHYAQREAEYQETVKDEEASMKALLKIGFYVDGTEIEPAAPVAITVQFLDENGLPEGKPITVVHFSDGGTEVLDGGSAVDNSTTFKMESFSEIAIGPTPDMRTAVKDENGSKKLPLSESFEYIDDAFHITFRVEGDAIVPEGTSESEGGGEEDTAPPTEEEGSAEEDAASGEESGEAVEEASGEAGTAAQGSMAVKTASQAEDTEATEGTAGEEAPAISDGTEEEGNAPSEKNSEDTADVPGNTEENTEEKNEDTEAKALNFTVKRADKDSEEYQAFVKHIEETDKASELLRLHVMSYSLTYGGVELDLSECKVTAVVEPAKPLQEKMEESIPEAAAYLLNGDGEVVKNGGETVPKSEAEPEEAGDTPAADSTESEDADMPEEEQGAAPEETPGTESDVTADGETGTEDEAGTDEEQGEESTEQQVSGDSQDAGTEDSTEAADGAGSSDDAEAGSGEDTAAGNPTAGSGEKAATGNPTADAVDEIAFVLSTMSADVVTDQSVAYYDGSEVGKIVVEMDSSVQFFAAKASGQPNPKFTVQYYANLDVVAYNDDSQKTTLADGKNTNELPVIDTKKKADGKSQLPTNGGGTSNKPNDNPIRTLYVNPTTGKLKTKSKLTEVYASRPYEYHKAPTINYINALIQNTSYTLKEIWVLKSEENGVQPNPESINRGDWNIHKYNKNLHFTNRELSDGVVEEGEEYIYIKDGNTIRLVYDTEKKDVDVPAAFYDYDIGDGFIYSNETNAYSGSNPQKTSAKNSNTWYMRTDQQGINSAGNYKNTGGSKLAFGNANSGSGLQHEQWSNNLLNKFNGTQNGHPGVSGSYKGCTFGLATELKNGEIVYAKGVNAPKLFNEKVEAGETVSGKVAYDNYSLKFDRVGDTHTLKAVNNANLTGLDSFNNPVTNGKPYYHIWTNNFWPMDAAPSYGTDGHDMKFGAYARSSSVKPGKDMFYGKAGNGPYSGNVGNYAGKTGAFPSSDDGLDHNAYFGMQYTVKFDLVADYVGPLEYYFFGDDDMWVFLGDEDGKNGKLVCDIGGVHSSVGEYLNLWDYIDKETEKIHRHTDACYANGVDKEPTCGYVDKKTFALNFFYTERGESGSTCWMQFTLPSVSSITPETTNADYGHLRVQKEVKVSINGKDYPLASGVLIGDKVYSLISDGKVLIGDKEYSLTSDGKVVINGEEQSLPAGAIMVIDGKQYPLTSDGKVTINGKNYPLLEKLFGGSEQDDLFAAKEYTFKLTLKGPNGKLKDDYAYIKYDKNGKVISGESGGGILSWETIADGEVFTLKDGEYIRIQYLPQGTTYTVEELNGDSANGGTVDVKGVVYQGTVTEQKETLEAAPATLEGMQATGTVPKDNMSEVKYTNKYAAYELPHTGGSGYTAYTIAGAICVMLGAGFVYRKKFRERRA